MAQQLALIKGSQTERTTPVMRLTPPRQARPLCAGCRARDAPSGFRNGEDAAPDDRPRTLCFDCFRMELGYRQVVAAERARGWNATQSALPLAERVARADRRRRRAQIAARHALGI